MRSGFQGLPQGPSRSDWVTPGMPNSRRVGLAQQHAALAVATDQFAVGVVRGDLSDIERAARRADAPPPGP